MALSKTVKKAYTTQYWKIFSHVPHRNTGHPGFWGSLSSLSSLTVNHYLACQQTIIRCTATEMLSES